MNPLPLSGPEFLVFFLLAGLGAVVTTLLLRWIVARPGRHGHPEEIPRRLHPTEVAFLLHGTDRAIEAAVAGLHHRGTIEREPGLLLRRAAADAVGPAGVPGALESDGVFRGHVAPESVSRTEDFVLTRLPAKVTDLCEWARHSYLPEELAARLEREGLLVENRGRASWIVRLPGLAWLALGAAKLAVGIERGRPVGALILLLLIGGVLVYLLARAPRLTWLGRQVARRLRSLDSLEITAQTAPQQLSHTEMGLAYAIFGHAVAPVTLMAMMPSFHAAMLAPAAASSSSSTSCGGATTCGGSSSGSSSSSSSDSGGGGSSCGSSCGGGCGGCS